MAFAATLLAVGLVFAGVAALVAQLTVNARSALGLSAIVLGTTYLVRAVGDMGDSLLPWFSPFGCAIEMRSYVDERWWPLVLAAVTTAVLLIAATAINARRDVGAGLVGDRVGASAASERLGIRSGSRSGCSALASSRGASPCSCSAWSTGGSPARLVSSTRTSTLFATIWRGSAPPTRPTSTSP